MDIVRPVVLEAFSSQVCPSLSLLRPPHTQPATQPHQIHLLLSCLQSIVLIKPSARKPSAGWAPLLDILEHSSPHGCSPCASHSYAPNSVQFIPTTLWQRHYVAPILRIRKLRYREVKWLIWIHTGWYRAEPRFKHREFTGPESSLLATKIGHLNYLH